MGVRQPVALADDEIVFGMRGLVAQIESQLSRPRRDEFRRGHFSAGARDFRAGFAAAGSGGGGGSGASSGPR